MSTQNEHAKNMLLGQLQAGAQNIPIYGNIVWWNIQNVELTKEQFEKLLVDHNIDKKYAREHNYRSAFIRALREMEENRIIRKVEEDEFRLTYQFTAEKMVKEAGGEHSLEYDKETVIIIDKVEYRKSGDFTKSLIKGKPAIKDAVVKLFELHRQKYKSSDITRYIQKIFRESADIISLRTQGSVYFVPAGYQQVLDNVTALIADMGNSRLDCCPVPAADASKTMLKNALTSDFNEEFGQLEKEIEEVLKRDKEVTKVWSSSRVNRLRKLLNRLEGFHNGGVVEDIAQWQNNLADMEKKILGVRHIDLDDDESVQVKVATPPTANSSAAG
jgi:hypothetical protein